MKTGDPMSDPAKLLVVHEQDTHKELADPGAPSSLIVPTVFSRAKYLEPSHTLHHLPFLFWLIEALRPRRLVEIGLDRGVSYFAACQAAERLDCILNSTGIGDWPGGVPEDLARYNEAQYQEFSTIVSMPGSEAAKRFEPASLDLLILDCPMEELEALLEAGWREKLSDKSVVLIHGAGRAASRPYLRQLCHAHDVFEFPHGEGLLVLGFGKELPAQITNFLDHASKPGWAEHLRRIFRRLGQGQVAEGRLVSLEADQAAREEERRAQADSELLERDLALAAQAEQVEALHKEREAWGDERGRLQAEIETLSRKVLSQAEQVDALQSEHAAWDEQRTGLQAEIETLSRKLSSQADIEAFEDLATERDRLMKVIELRDIALSEAARRETEASLEREELRQAIELRDTALSEAERKEAEASLERDGLAAMMKEAKDTEDRQTKQIAELEARLREAQGELGAMVGFAEENERMRGEIERMTSEISGLRTSTSWKLTAPMRAVVLKLRS